MEINGTVYRKPGPDALGLKLVAAQKMHAARWVIMGQGNP
jgi:hypothetical protein